ncbi:type I secretion system permease/ATPase [Undibacterium cyanobacteriorum]|uniref:Type I secretion system permease/ATPase n=1 Tax=Undibacterium cyanobacteriorum TaxID=3073561 RepID=A0ABY9RLE1_9BURK|nr:type I secretion system permease/ATPase [Undibacterium sp. 20NA77.5]WMW81085.1 type I secretion system permease/ATPase [Undibacterium sp. 20NA77.5]
MLNKMQLPKNEITEVLSSFKSAFRTLAIFSAIINMLMLVPSLYMLQVYDRVLQSRNELTLLMLTLLMLGAYLLMNALEFIRSFALIRVSAKLDMQLNKRVYTAAFEQNLKKAGGNAGQALSDLTQIRQFLTGNGLFAFFDAPWFPIYLAVIFMFDFWLGVFALVGVIVMAALAYANEVVTRKPLAEANGMSVVAGTMATNNLRNAEVIEAMGMLPNLMTRWFTLHSKFLSLQAEASEKAGIISAASKFVRISMQSLVLGLGALLVIEGKMSPGMMIAGSILLGKATGPIDQIIGVSKQWSGVVTAYKRLVELLNNNPARIENMELPKPAGALAVEAVTAAPPGAKVAVIKGLSFAIQPGDVLGIIGPSGSGKSTLARLLVGVWPAAVGKVRLDNADIYHWNKDQLGPHIGYLPQDIELFAGSVAENIARFGEVDSEKVIQAAKRAGVHDMILHFPEGYDTRLGDGGGGLSGGQKQRIGLARAMYDDPSLLVLDEPNSNLDDVGEQALLAAVNDLRQRGKTIVLITHRPTTLSATTKLLLLRDGAAQAFGPTNEVLAALQQAQAQAQAQMQAQLQGRAPGQAPAPANAPAPGQSPAAAQAQVQAQVQAQMRAAQMAQAQMAAQAAVNAPGNVAPNASAPTATAEAPAAPAAGTESNNSAQAGKE